MQTAIGHVHLVNFCFGRDTVSPNHVIDLYECKLIISGMPIRADVSVPCPAIFVTLLPASDNYHYDKWLWL